MVFSLTYHREQVRVIDCGIPRMILGFLVIQNERGSNTKVSTKCVDEHWASDVRCLQHVDIQSLVDWVEHDLKEGNDDQLEVADTAKQCTHRDQNNSCCKIWSHHPACVRDGVYVHAVCVSKRENVLCVCVCVCVCVCASIGVCACAVSARVCIHIQLCKYDGICIKV